MCVTSIAIPASELAATALPALNPNHPTQSMAAPITTRLLLWGGMADPGNPFLLPNTKAATNAPTPQVKWTTSPPAKSITPHWANRPPPQTMWQAGKYTNVSHNAEKRHMAENFILSAKAPTTKAGVIMAKVIWNMTNTVSGIVPERLSLPMPDRNAALKSPTKAPSPLKERL